MAKVLVTRLLVYVSLALAVLALPGVGEVLENLGHWVGHGHAAHAAGESLTENAPSAEHDEHPADAEHGCVGDLHTCVCHSHAPMAFTSCDVGGDLGPVVAKEIALPFETGGSAGVLRSLFRPPIG